MTEQETIQLVTQQVAALNARDLDGYLRRLDESYEGQSEIAPGPIRGRDGARQFLEGLFRAFSDMHLEIEQIIAGDNAAAVRLSGAGTHTGTFAGIPPTNKASS